MTASVYGAAFRGGSFAYVRIMTLFLFIAVSLLWGLTWFAIHLQIGGTTVDVAIFWRFALSVLVMGAGLAATGRLRRPPRAALPWLAAMGACLFSCNFLGIYMSEIYLPSGTVSVVFSMSIVFNALNQRIFFRQPLDGRVLAGGVLGAFGVALMLGGGVPGGSYRSEALGIGFALVGTTLFSLGNMISRRASRFSLGLLNTVFYAMMFGALIMAANVLIHGHGFSPVMTTRWLGGLLYLSLFGSVAGFLFYLALAERIGADRAAYTTILSPVIALGVSAMFEGAQWSLLITIGLVLILCGNVVAFMRPRTRPEATPVAELEQG